MAHYLHPSFHIFDANEKFFISSHERKIELTLKFEQRKKVYELIKKIKNNEGKLKLPLSKYSMFEQKIIKILMKYGFFIEQRQQASSVMVDNIYKLCAPPALIDILSETSNIRNIAEIDYESSSMIFDNETSQHVYVYVLPHQMYITPMRHEYLEQSTPHNRLLLKYAAYVLLDKLRNNELPLEFDHIIAINLDNYENILKVVKISDITPHNFESSFLADKHLCGYTYTTNYDFLLQSD